MDTTNLRRRSSEETFQQLAPTCDCSAYDEWVRTVALRVLQIAAQGLFLLEVKGFPFSKTFTDVKALGQGVGATFAGFDLITVARGVRESWEEGDWSYLTFNGVPSVFLALSDIRVVACRTDLSSAIPMPSALSKGAEFLQKHISPDYVLFAAGLSVSFFHIKASASKITSWTNKDDLSENGPHMLRVIANVTFTAYHALGLGPVAHALGLGPAGLSSLKMVLLVASTACTFLAGPVKPDTLDD